jgi:hypothetical protein
MIKKKTSGWFNRKIIGVNLKELRQLAGKRVSRRHFKYIERTPPERLNLATGFASSAI